MRFLSPWARIRASTGRPTLGSSAPTRARPARVAGSDRTTRRPSRRQIAASATASGASKPPFCENRIAVSRCDYSERTIAVSAASGHRACTRIGMRSRSRSPCRLVEKLSTPDLVAA